MRQMRLFILFIVVAWLFAGAALAQIIVVSGANSAVTALTRSHAEQLYLGRAQSLPDGVAVRLADLPAGPLRDQFYLQLTGKNPSQIRAHWSRMVFTGRALPPQEAADVAQVRAWLAGNPNLIAYLPASEADARLKVLLRLP